MAEREEREKVIDGLKCCKEAINIIDPICGKCPYEEYAADCVSLLTADAFELLKAQHDDIKALRQLVEWAEECGFGLDNIPWYEYATEEELDKVHGYIETMICVARKAVNLE